MGLDMYATSIRAHLVTNEDRVDVPLLNRSRAAVGFHSLNMDEYTALNPADKKEYNERCNTIDRWITELGLEPKDFAYWRKFSLLHEWMHALYVLKGGAHEEFNCTNLRLTAADLDALENWFKGFGPTTPEGWTYHEIQDQVDVFIRNARLAIIDGDAIYYSAWY